MGVALEMVPRQGTETWLAVRSSFPAGHSIDYVPGIPGTTLPLHPLRSSERPSYKTGHRAHQVRLLESSLVWVPLPHPTLSPQGRSCSCIPRWRYLQKTPAMPSGMDHLGLDTGTPVRHGRRLSRALWPEAISPRRRTADSSPEWRMCPTHVCLRAHSILECECHGHVSMQWPTLAASFPGCPWPAALPPSCTYRPPSRLTS